jgi:hypothetical protein
MPRLSDASFDATFAGPMRDVMSEATDVIDVWPYVSAVPQEDLLGHQIWDQFVENVYRDANNRYDHVLVITQTKNVYLVVVIDLVWDRIYGHHLLDLNEKYGLPKAGSA